MAPTSATTSTSLALTGRSVFVYGQTEVQEGPRGGPCRAAGQQVHYEVTDTALHNLESERPSVSFTDVDGVPRRLLADAVAGCDGSFGPSRGAVPPGVRRSWAPAPPPRTSSPVRPTEWCSRTGLAIPRRCGADVQARELLGKVPLLGICLGNQILALAMGGKTYKLKFGHRGANHPVRDVIGDKIDITSQNHGFAVDPKSLKGKVQVTHVNLYDGTVEGIAAPELRMFAVQYHPEDNPGPHDSRYLFRRFVRMIEGRMIQPQIDLLLQWAAPQVDELLRGREEYFAGTGGEVHEDDRCYEQRMQAFFNWFLFDRRQADGATPVERFLREKGAELAAKDKDILLGCTQSRLGLYEYRGTRGGLFSRPAKGQVRVRDIVTGEKLRRDRAPADARAGRGRPLRGAARAAGTHLALLHQLHLQPREVYAAIRREIKRRKKQGPVDARALVWELERMGLQHERFRNVSIEAIYNFETPFLSKRPRGGEAQQRDG